MFDFDYTKYPGVLVCYSQFLKNSIFDQETQQSGDMISLAGEHPLIALLNLCATREVGVTCYTQEQWLKPVNLSYSELRALATQRANYLRRYEGVIPGKIILIHFHAHLENIIWFWASILAGCIPTISTQLVNDTEGRKSHFKHLHRLLLDPIVITRLDLVDSDFAQNNILRVVPVEAIEASGCFETLAAAKSQAEIQTKGTNNGKYENSTKAHANGSSNNFSESAIDNPRNDSVHITEIERSRKSSCNSFEAMVNEDTECHADGATQSTEGVAILMLTSGSTGSAKAVCLTHRQILAAIRGKLFSMPLPQGTALFNWIGLDHVASLVEIHLCAMFAGLEQIHVPAKEMLGNPLEFLRLLSVHRVSRTFAPNFFLKKLLDVLERAAPSELTNIDLHHLLYIASGGEPNSVITCTRVSEHLAKLGTINQRIIVPGFGMTETCAGAIFSLNCPDIDILVDHEFAALGTCVPGIEMRIAPISDTTHVVEAGNEYAKLEGALELRGPIIFERYFNNDEATRNSFTPDGWFKTGDLATIDSRAGLKLIGRTKELIYINGVKYLPYELEEAIGRARIPGVTQGFIACFAHCSADTSTEQIQVVYQHDFDAHDCKARLETLHSIIQTIMLFAGVRPRVLPLPPGRLERSTLGKLSRTKIRNSLVQGQYINEEDLDAMMQQSYHETHFMEPRDDVERTLMDILLESFRLDGLTMGIDTTFLETGVSSVDLIRLKAASEKAFDIADIPMIAIMTNTTIRSLASVIKQIRTSPFQGEYNPVVTLQRNGPKTPLWLIHPGIGEMLVFLRLVQYFPDRPVHAMRARGFNPGEKPFNDLEEILAIYHSAIKKQQPYGPYAIAGYSYGSMLGFEVSKVLEANGDNVQFLASFNLPPHIKQRMRMLDWTAGLLHIAHFCGIITEQRSEELVGELCKLSPREQVSSLLAESDQQRCAELALTRASLYNWVNVAWALQKIGWEYDPSGSVGGMDVFYCQPLKVVARTREEYRTTKLNHWVDFVREDVRFHEVDGEHYTMIGPEHVPKFQQTLKKAMAARGL